MEQYGALLKDFTLVPQKVDRVSESVLYLGYALPRCEGADDAKWLIQLKIVKGTEETVGYANGEKKFNQAWSERRNLTYKITEYATESFSEADADESNE